MKSTTSILTAMLVVCFVGGMTAVFGDPNGTYQKLNAIAFSAIELILAIQWCRLDARDKDASFPAWLLWVSVLLLPVGLVIHFFRTRPASKAFRAIALSILFFCGIMTSTIAGAMASLLGPCQIATVSGFCTRF